MTSKAIIKETDSFKPLPSQERLKALFDYNPETGDLTWKRRPYSDFKHAGRCDHWNMRFAGKIAGYARDDGRRSVVVGGTIFLTHRIIWVIMFGYLPPNTILDHANGNPLDNRISNIRIATRLDNCRNQKTPSVNTSGAMGVSRTRNGLKWRARINVNCQEVRLGHFASFDDAVRARLAAERKYFGEFAPSLREAA